MIFIVPASAQFRLPQIDIEAKGVGSIFDAGNNESISDIAAISGQGAFHVQVNQHIALGVVYAKSFLGKVHHQDGNHATTAKNDLKLLMTGLDLRLSAGRSVKWRPYLSLNYSKVEFIEQYSGYNLAHSTNAIGANIGVMLRLGNNLYWNVVEVGAKSYKDKVFWLGTDFTAEAKTGFTYNIRIKSK